MYSFALCFAAALVIWIFVDIPKGRADAVAFAAEERGPTAEVPRDVGEPSIPAATLMKH